MARLEISCLIDEQALEQWKRHFMNRNLSTEQDSNMSNV